MSFAGIERLKPKELKMLGKRKSIRLDIGEGLASIRANLLADPQQIDRKKLMFCDTKQRTYRGFSLPVWLKRGYELYRIRNFLIEWDEPTKTFRLVPKVSLRQVTAATAQNKNKFKWLVDEKLVTHKIFDVGRIGDDNVDNTD
jgi:hypothetical protein